MQLSRLSNYCKDPFPDSYFEILNTGTVSGGGGVRVQIAATSNDLTSPDRDAPAVDVSIYTTASEEGDEIALRDLIITSLNNNSNFEESLKAQDVRDLAIVHIYSIFRGEFYERPNANDFYITALGDASVQMGFNTLEIRGKETALARDANYPHKLGTLGISGQVSTIPQAIGKLSVLFAENATYGSEMAQDGSVTPIIYTVDCDTEEDVFVKEIRFFGSGAGLKFGQFMNINKELSNGVEVKIKSDDQVITLPLIYITEEFKEVFALGTVNFSLDIGAGLDNFLASFKLDVPFPLRKCGSFDTDDYISVKIQDDIGSVASLKFIAFGFRED